MTTDTMTRRMQAVLDGGATAEDIATLDATLASDPEAMREFAAWQMMFDGLAAMPQAHPPEDLVARITAGLPDAPLGDRAEASHFFFIPDQLSSDATVIGSGNTQTTRRPFGFKTGFNHFSNWLMPVSSRESHMNTQRKVLAGGAVAVVALGIAAVLIGYPPKSDDVVGTVVPAERYRAAQTGAEAVKLGEPATSQINPIAGSAGTPAAGSVEAGAQADRAIAQSQADKSSAQMQADKSSAQMQADRASAQSQADKSSAQMQADRASAQSQADKSSAQMQADRASAQSQADKSSAQMQADRASAQSQADKSSAQMQADRASAQSQADKSSAQMQADRASAQSQADKSSAQMRADRASAQSQADKSSAQMRADRASAQSQADKSSAQMQADRAAEYK